MRWNNASMLRLQARPVRRLRSIAARAALAPAAPWTPPPGWVEEPARYRPSMGVSGHDGGRAAKTVLHEPGLRATLIALRCSHELAEHDAPPAASLQVLSGNVRLVSATGATVLRSGQMAAIPHERHSLIADGDALVLLTVRFE